MAFTAKVVPFQVAAGQSSGTLQITSPGFGTPQCAIFVLSGASATSLARTNNAKYSRGWTDGITQRVISSYAANSSSSNISGRVMRRDAVVSENTASAMSGALAFSTWITDGAELTYRSAFDLAAHGYVILMAGAENVEVGEFNFGSGVNNYTHILAGAFPPSLVFGQTTTGNPSGFSTNYNISTGVACRGAADAVTQHVNTHFGNNGYATSLNSVRNFTGSLCGAGDGDNAAGFNRELNITGWNADGFDVGRTAGSSTFGIDCQYLAIELPAGQIAVCGQAQYPTTIGTQLVPTGYISGEEASVVAEFFGSDLASNGGSNTSSRADAFGSGAVDSDLSQSACIEHIRDDISVSDAGSYFSNADVLAPHVQTGVNTNRAACTALTGNNLTLDYSYVDGLGRYFNWWAVQAAPAPAAGAKIRRVVYQLAAGQGSGTFDVTHPDIDTPDCWIGFISGSTAVDGSRQPHAHLGVFSGTAAGMLGLANRAQNGVGTSNTARVQRDDAHLLADATESRQGYFDVNSVISGGVRFVYTGSFARAFQLELFLFEGCEEVSLEDNTNLNGGTYSGMAGYPDLLFVYGTTGDDSPSNTAKASIGFATRDPSDNSIQNQWALGWESQNNNPDVRFGGGVLDGYILGRTSTSIAWFERYSLASFNSTGYTFSNVSSGLTGARILAIRFPADQQVLSGIRQFATSVGADSIPTTYQSGLQDSDFVFIGGATPTTTATTQPRKPTHALVFGGADKNLGQASVSFIDQDGSVTSQSESQFDSSNIINYAQGGTGTVYKTTSVTSLDGGQITLDHSVNNGEAAWYGWFTLQSGAAAPPGEPADIDLPAVAATARADAPTITAPQSVDIDLPAASPTAKADAPAVDAPSDKIIDLPAAAATGRADAPSIDAPRSADIALPAASPAARADAPTITIPSGADVDLPAVAATARADAPAVDAPRSAGIALPAASPTARADVPSIDVPQPVDVNLPAVAATGRADAPAVDAPRSADIALPAVTTTAKADVPAVDAPSSKTIDLPAGSVAATAPAPTTDYPLTRRTPILGIPKNPRNELFIDVNIVSRPDFTLYLYNETALPVASFENPAVTLDDGNNQGPNPGNTANGPVWAADPRGEGPELYFDTDVPRAAQILGLAGRTRPYTLLTIVYQPNTNAVGRGIHVFGDGGTPDDDYVGHWQDSVNPAPFRGYGELQSQGKSRGYIATESVDLIEGDYTVLAIAAADANDIGTYVAHLPTDSAFSPSGNFADDPGVTPPIADFPLNRWWLGLGRADTDNGTPRFNNGYAIAHMVWQNRAVPIAELDAFLAGGLFQHIVAESEVTPGADIYLPRAQSIAKADAPNITADENTFISLPALAPVVRADPPAVDADTGITSDLPALSITARASNPLTSAIIVNPVDLPAVATSAKADNPTTTIPDPPIFVCPAKAPGYCATPSLQRWPFNFDTVYSFVAGHPGFTVMELFVQWRDIETAQDNYSALHAMLDAALAFRDARAADPTPVNLHLALILGVDRFGGRGTGASFLPDYINDDLNTYPGDDRGGIFEQQGGMYTVDPSDPSRSTGILTADWDGFAGGQFRNRAPLRERKAKVFEAAYAHLQFRGRADLLAYVVTKSETAKKNVNLQESYSFNAYQAGMVDYVARTRSKLDALGGTDVAIFMGINSIPSGIKQGEWAAKLFDPIAAAGGAIGIQDPFIVYDRATHPKLEGQQWMRENNGTIPGWWEGDPAMLKSTDPVTGQIQDPVRLTSVINGTMADDFPTDYNRSPDGYKFQNAFFDGGIYLHYFRWIYSVSGAAQASWLNAVDTKPLLQSQQCGQYPLADVAPPVISPATGIYPLPLQVTITEDPNADATYYTIGPGATSPTEADMLYTGPFQVTQTSTVSARSLRGTLWTVAIHRVYTEQGTTGDRSPRLRIPLDSRSLLTINTNAVNRPTATWYWAGGPTRAEVASFEDSEFVMATGAGDDNGEPEFEANPNGEGPEIKFLGLQESLFATLGDQLPSRPLTFLCIERFEDGLVAPDLTKAAWAAGDGLGEDYFSFWKTGDGTNTFGAYAEQGSQGNGRDFWNAQRFALDPTKYRYQVISYASGTDCKAYMANDDAVAFTPMGDMTDGFTSPLTDFTFPEIWLGGGRVDTPSPVPRWDGHIIGFMVWTKVLTEAELNTLLNRPNKFFDHIVSATGANIDMPAVAATAQAAGPDVIAETNQDFVIPAVAATVAAQAPIITTSTDEDAFIDLPAASALAFARQPTISGPIPVLVDMPRVAATGRASAPTVESGEDADIDLPAASATAKADVPTITAELQPADIDLPAASVVAQASPLAITTVGADVALGTASATAQARTVIITTTDALAQPFPYEFFQPGDRSRYGIQVPTENVQSLQRSAMQAKEAIEALLGYRGSLYEGLNFGGSSDQSEPQDFSQLLEYLQTVEDRLVEHDERISGNADTNDVQDGRLDGIDAEQITQNTRLDALEAGGGEDLEPRVEALETNDAVQDGRLDGIDVEQVTQNSRIFQNEQDIALLQTAAQFLLDGTYAFGRRTSRLRWSPANSGSNPNTRISFDEVTLLSNVQHPDNFSFTPDYEADYFVNVNLRFAPDSSGDEWYIQTYVNGSGAGSPFYFKPDEVSGGEQVLMSAQFGFHMVPGDVLDIRLWPDDSGKAGWIEVFDYSMIGMGLDGIPVSS